LPNQVDRLGHGAYKAAQRFTAGQPLALRRYCCIIGAKSPGWIRVFSIVL
jgi:hypothetical protein